MHISTTFIAGGFTPPDSYDPSYAAVVITVSSVSHLYQVGQPSRVAVKSPIFSGKVL